MSRSLHRMTNKIRQPFGPTPRSEDMFPEDEHADALAAGPVQALVKRLVQP